MSKTVTLSPVTRIEGHLAVHTEVESDGGSYRVSEAHCEGEMYRGFEQLLKGRDPMDAQQITQRICGVCPISHATASCRAQEEAYGIKPNHNGRLLQNLILSANYIQSHLIHFYQLAALDFVDVTAVLDYTGRDRTLLQIQNWVKTGLEKQDPFPAAPFLPRFDVDYIQNKELNISLLSHYIEALRMRQICHEMASIFGARLPHSTAIIPGGCTQIPTMERVLSYAGRLDQIVSFVKHIYVPDILGVAQAMPEYFDIGRSYDNFLSFGVFEMNDSNNDRFFSPGVLTNGTHSRLNPDAITEDVATARFKKQAPQHPYSGTTEPEPHRPGAYTWMKAPRYGTQPMEVGPLARILVNYHDPDKAWLKQSVDEFCSTHGVAIDKLNSVLGRHAARGLESIWLLEQMGKWIDEIQIGEKAAVEIRIPETGKGAGLTEAPRGALGHWLTLKDHKIDNYQCVVPTTWNGSPRDSKGVPGPVEKALVNTPVEDPDQPVEVARVVHSFDPCLACAIH